eukprot:1160892-Pelagomonas_calceolata.AAC.1
MTAAWIQMLVGPAHGSHGMERVGTVLDAQPTGICCFPGAITGMFDAECLESCSCSHSPSCNFRVGCKCEGSARHWRGIDYILMT